MQVDDLSPLIRLQNLEKLNCEYIPCKMLQAKEVQLLKNAMDLAELRDKWPNLGIVVPGS
jgi:hypothetical protein